MYTCIRSVKISWAYAMHKGLPHFILKTSIPSRGFCFPSSLFLFQTYLTRFARESLFPSSSRFPTRSTMLARARYRRIEQHNIYERCALCQLVTHTAEKEWSKKKSRNSTFDPYPFFVSLQRRSSFSLWKNTLYLIASTVKFNTHRSRKKSGLPFRVSNCPRICMRMPGHNENRTTGGGKWFELWRN